MDKGAWWAIVRGGHKELDTAEQLRLHTFICAIIYVCVLCLYIYIYRERERETERETERDRETERERESALPL